MQQINVYWAKSSVPIFQTRLDSLREWGVYADTKLLQLATVQRGVVGPFGGRVGRRGVPVGKNPAGVHAESGRHGLDHLVLGHWLPPAPLVNAPHLLLGTLEIQECRTFNSKG